MYIIVFFFIFTGNDGRHVILICFFIDIFTILSKFSSRRHILLHNMQNQSMKSELHIRNKIIYKPHHEKPCFCKKKKKTKAKINCEVSTPLFHAFVFV